MGIPFYNDPNSGIMQVLADIVSILAEKPDIVTLDICTCVLPLLTSLLESEIDQYE